MPAIATTLLGGVAGLWLGSGRVRRAEGLGLFGGGIAAMLIGWVWSFAFPLNKSLWTSSYVWFTGGAASVFLAFCYALIDLRGWKAWARPFVILGLNAIALFVLSGLGTKFLMNHKVMGPDGKPISWLSLHLHARGSRRWPSPINASLLFALANLAVLFVVLWFMDGAGMYLKA